MTGLFAGGLRNRRSAEAREIREPGSSVGLGTDIGVGLEQTYAPRSGADSGSPGCAVLGQGPPRCAAIGSATFHFATKLLPP